MKSAIVKKMVIALVIALTISSVISGIFCYRLLETEITDEMTDLLNVLDYSIDRKADLNSQMKEYKNALNGKYRITLIGLDGTVLADSDSEDISGMENHAQRKEVQEAIAEGRGYESRISDTFSKSMIYAAIYSKEHQDILRFAVETSAVGRIILMNIPVFLFSFAVSLFVAVLLTRQLAGSITRPLMEIAKELSDFAESSNLPPNALFAPKKGPIMETL